MGSYTCDIFRCGICCKELCNIEDYVRHMVIQEQCHLVLSPCKILHNLLLPRFKPTGVKRNKLDTILHTEEEILEESEDAIKVLTGESSTDVRWKCRLCNLTFSRRAALANHSALVHNSSLFSKQSSTVKDISPRCKKPKLEHQAVNDSLTVAENTTNSNGEPLFNDSTELQNGKSFKKSSILLQRLHSEISPGFSLDNSSEGERNQAFNAPCAKNDSEYQSQHLNENYDTNTVYFPNAIHNRATDFYDESSEMNASQNGTILDIKNTLLSQEPIPEVVPPAIHIFRESGGLQLESKPLVTLKVSDEFPTKDLCSSKYSELQVVADDEDCEPLQESWENNHVIDLENPQNDVINLDLGENVEKDDDIVSIYEVNGLSCKHCSETFKTSRTLQQHLSIVHAPHKPYVCAFQDCGQAFKTKGSLTRHHRRHTGERPFVCSVCGRSFRESGTLQRHRQSKVSCANKTDNQLTRYRAALPLPHADSKACLAKLLLKKEEVLCGDDSRGPSTSAALGNDTLPPATASMSMTSPENIAVVAATGSTQVMGDTESQDEENHDEHHQKPVTFAAGRIIKQERIEAKHQQAANVAPATTKRDECVEASHKSKQQLSLLSIKQEAGGRLQLQQPAKPRCKLECPEPEPSPSDDEEGQWDEPESPCSLSHPPDSPGSVVSLNPSLVDVPPYPMHQFAGDNRFGDYGAWEEETDGDMVQSPGDSRDVKPRLAFADIKPRVNVATPDIKPRFQHTSMQDDATHYPCYMSSQDTPPAGDTTPSALPCDGMHSTGDAPLSASWQTDGHTVNFSSTAAGGTSPVYTSDNTEAVQATNSHSSLLPVDSSKTEFAFAVSSVDHIAPVPGVFEETAISNSLTEDSNAFSEVVLKPPTISTQPYIYDTPVTSSIVVASTSYSDLPPSAFSGFKGSFLSNLALSEATTEAIGHTSSNLLSSSMVIPPSSPNVGIDDDDPSHEPCNITAPVPTPPIVAPVAAGPSTTVFTPRPPADNTTVGGGSSEPLKVVFNCPHCDRSFDARSALMTHLYTHYNKLGPQCSECNKSFSSRQGVVRHLVRHASVRRFVCTQCNQHFSHPSQLLQHRLSHSEHKPVLCNVCGRSFKTVSSRNLHARAAHAGAREECPVCNRGFSTRGSLIRHQRTHSGARPYACRHCQAAFRDQGTLARHLRYKKPCCILEKAPPHTEPEPVILNDAASVIDEENYEELHSNNDDTEQSVDLCSQQASNIVPVSLNEHQLDDFPLVQLANERSSIRVVQHISDTSTTDVILDLNNPPEEDHLVIQPEAFGNTSGHSVGVRLRQLPSVRLVESASNVSANEEDQVVLNGPSLEYIFDQSSVENEEQGRQFDATQEPEEPERIVYIRAFN